MILQPEYCPHSAVTEQMYTGETFFSKSLFQNRLGYLNECLGNMIKYKI